MTSTSINRVRGGGRPKAGDEAPHSSIAVVTQSERLFELSHTGTLFLDDIDDVPPPVQAKLLRVLESHQVMRVGGTTTIPIDVRLISASKVDVKELVSRGLFRADLFYGINVCPIEIPPLRDRREDAPLLIDHFLRRFVPQKRLALSNEAAQLDTAYYWPANVRELRNVVQQIALFADGEIRPEHLPLDVREGGDFAVRQWHHLMMWFFIVFSMVHVYLVFYHDYVERRGVLSSMAGGWKFVEKRNI